MHYMHIKTIHREMQKLQSTHIAKYCTLGSNISTEGFIFYTLAKFATSPATKHHFVSFLLCNQHNISKLEPGGWK